MFSGIQGINEKKKHYICTPSILNLISLPLFIFHEEYLIKFIPIIIFCIFVIEPIFLLNQITDFFSTIKFEMYAISLNIYSEYQPWTF